MNEHEQLTDEQIAEDPATYFHGHAERECGEHRTVGAHRAWCYDCGEWCYPRIDAACRGCEIATMRAEVLRLRAQVAAVEALCDDADERERNSLSRMINGQPFPTIMHATDIRAALAADVAVSG